MHLSQIRIKCVMIEDVVNIFSYCVTWVKFESMHHWVMILSRVLCHQGRIQYEGQKVWQKLSETLLKMKWEEDEDDEDYGGGEDPSVGHRARSRFKRVHRPSVVPQSALMSVWEGFKALRGLTQISRWFPAWGNGARVWATIMGAVVHAGREALRSCQMTAVPEALDNEMTCMH